MPLLFVWFEYNEYKKGRYNLSMIGGWVVKPLARFRRRLWDK